MRERMSDAERQAYQSGNWHRRHPPGAEQLTLEVDFEPPIPAPKVARSPRRQEASEPTTKRRAS